MHVDLPTTTLNFTITFHRKSSILFLGETAVTRMSALASTFQCRLKNIT